MRRILFLLLLSLSSFSLYAQEETPKDSIHVTGTGEKPLMQGTIGNEGQSLSKGEIMYNTCFTDDTNTIELELPPLFYYAGPQLEDRETRHPMANDYTHAGAVNIGWSRHISGGSMQRTYMGSGRMQTATINYSRLIDDQWTASAGLTINKQTLDRIGANTSLYSEAVLSGEIGYQINDRMNLSLSGDYSIYRTGRSDGTSPGSLMGNYFPEDPGVFSYGFRPVYWTELQFGYQVTDWLYVAPGMYSSRHEFYNNHFNDYGFNGMVGLRVHERVKFNLYGKKSLRGTNYSFGPRGLHPQDMYGGGIELKINENFSVESGIIREINPWNGKWETKPYVRPVFHIK
ncbi:hypothetical protein [Dysgonomonas sp. 25]|uniref:hypothetical protein n=1 Tax=Dysgonomonas sp. 25 TaxID=2302933 RepID=UPI0013D66001|nr:hypothetical protein [Dysgonomonas sp. 25]NDV69591.1 hypothetical protein [Dysgonomonas sp. 25]